MAKLPPDRALSDVLRDLKCNASGWMHDIFPKVKDFSWQRGYGAFTVSQSHVEDVRRYLERQKEHHQRISFRAEFVQFLQAYGIAYDERFCDHSDHQCIPTLWMTKKSPAARFTGYAQLRYFPGAHAPGFMLTPAFAG